jgi:hypothetical protein
MTSQDTPAGRSWPRRTLSVAASAAVAGALLWAGPLPGAAAGEVGTADTTAPSTPEVELLGDPPRAGELATLRFTSADPDSGLKGFWYGIHEEVKRDFVAAPAPAGVPGVAEVTFPVPPEGGRIFVYVWAEDIADNFSDRAIFDWFAERDLPPPPEAAPIASWPLNATTDDVLGGNHLTLPGVEGADYDWVADRVCFPQSALYLHGSAGAYAATAGEVIATDESFSVAAWVVPGAPTGEDQTVLSQSGAMLSQGGQGGAIRSAVMLQQTAEGSWRFAVPHVSPARPEGVAQTAPGSVKVGVWNHLAGVVDLVEGEIRLYVNGELAATGEVADAVGRAQGPFYLGVAGTRLSTGSPFSGAIDGVWVWSGRLLASQIRDLGLGGGMLQPCF